MLMMMLMLDADADVAVPCGAAAVTSCSLSAVEPKHHICVPNQADRGVCVMPGMDRYEGTSVAAACYFGSGLIMSWSKQEQKRYSYFDHVQ